MMKKKCLLLFIILLCFLAACTPDKGAKLVANMPITGTWLLQKQDVTVYANGVKQSYNEYTASDTSYCNLQFKTNGLFGGFSETIFKGTAMEVDSVSGTYTYNANSFSVNGPLPGFIISGGFFGTGGVPVFTPVSNLAQVTQLTAAKLAIHSEYVYNSTLNNVTTNYKLVNDYYFNK